MYYAQIVLPLNLKGTFTYKVPKEIINSLKIGMRVLIPFQRKKIYTGIVFDIHDKEPETFTSKEIISILDDQPILPKEQIDFWNWISEYYLCNLGEIYRFAFPSSLKLESETYIKLKSNIEINFEHLDSNETYIIQALEVRQLLNLSDIEAFVPKKLIIKTINSLIDLQYIEIDEKVAEKYKSKEVVYVKITESLLNNQDLSNILNQLKRAPKQQELFLRIFSEQSENNVGYVRKSLLFDDNKFLHSQLKALVDKNFVEEFVIEESRLKEYDGITEDIEQLSEIQKTAKKQIDIAFSENKNVLLHGITSSGKTHIYLEKIEECIKSGKNAMFLLPEVALTKQITKRLEKKYGNTLGFYHQKLTDFERVEVWKKIKNNSIKILIATRNALFLPFENLGLIIVDEEHDQAYRSKDISPYFQAKDAALILGQIHKANIILGSATPSVESYYLAKKNKLQYVFLGERFGNVDMPKFEIIDFKEAQESKKTSGNFTFHLMEMIRKNLEDKNQTLILHNRRGYANVVECESCGYATYCSNCDVVMTYHKATNEMKCHYCGHKAGKPKICPKCHSENLNEKGVGVEQIQEEIAKIFPEADVERMDIDSMRKKFAYEKLYEKIENRETDIIVGTQMISKGLDFDHIELVAVPKADSLLYIQDFRAEERTYQLLMQVSGRAGRNSGQGKILIQTYNPQHPVFELIKEQDSEKIYAHFLQERKNFNYPPYTKTILIELKHRKDDKVGRASQFLGSVLRKYLPEECILGPERAPISRLNNLYQFQILLKLPRGKNYSEYKKLVQMSIYEFHEIIAYQSVKLQLFVDF